MKKLILITTLLATASTAFAGGHTMLKSYKKLVKALGHGDNVRAIIRPERCVASDPSRDFSGRMASLNFDDFYKHTVTVNGQKHDLITTNKTILVNKPGVGHAINFVELHVMADNTATVSAELLQPQDKKTIFSVGLTCEVNNGKNHGGVTLYNMSK